MTLDPRIPSMPGLSTSGFTTQAEGGGGEEGGVGGVGRETEGCGMGGEGSDTSFPKRYIFFPPKRLQIANAEAGVGTKKAKG